MKVRELVAPTQWFPSGAREAQRPLVSVLLPTFRRGASGLFLRAARSVLEQELRELELIVVDDGSSDGTAEQIRGLMAADPRVHCLHHPRNVGLPAVAEYEAYRRARADWIAFAFDDDDFLPGALRRLHEEAVARRCLFLHGHVELHATDHVTGQSERIEKCGVGAPQSLLWSNNYIPNLSVLVHREVLETVGLYDPHVCMARLCDWDLFRRVAERYPIEYVDVPVGRQYGPATRDSVGHTYLMEFWSSYEWMALPRNEMLRPGRFEEYDVLSIPTGLARATRIALSEVSESFRDKHWYPQPEGPPAQRAGGGAAGGPILVLNVSCDMTTTMHFESLPEPYASRIRIAHAPSWGPGIANELVGASAVVFVRALVELSPLVEVARRIGLPHYYFLDDNLMVLAREPAFRERYAAYNDDDVRKALRSFSGVLLSTPSLIEYFKDRQLHDRLHFYPLISRPLRDFERPPAARDRTSLRIAYFGGPHRNEPFRRDVLPAIVELSGRYDVELVVAGTSPDVLPLPPQVKATFLPYEQSYDVALWRLTLQAIDVLVHPNNPEVDNRFRSYLVLVNAMRLGAAAVLSRSEPYHLLPDGEVALLCGDGARSWAQGLELLAGDPDLRQRLAHGAARYCREHLAGDASRGVLDRILAAHPSPGLVLRDQRHRAALAHFREEHRAALAQLREEHQAAQAAAETAHASELRRLTDSFVGVANRLAAMQDGGSHGRDLWDSVPSGFAHLEQATALRGRGRPEWVLGVSRNLRVLPYEEYRLALARGGNVSSIRLAFAVEMPGSPGNVGIEVVSREGRILAEAVVLLSDFDPQLPVTFPLPSLRFDPRQPWNVRVFSRGSPAPVRVFELRCSRWGGLRRERELFVAVEWSTHDASP